MLKERHAKDPAVQRPSGRAARRDERPMV